jgi:tight adherence protein C
MDIMLLITAFVAASCLVAFVVVWTTGLRSRLTERLSELKPDEFSSGVDTVGKLVTNVIPRMGFPLIPESIEEKDKLRTRLIRAGFYGEQAVLAFPGAKMLLIMVPTILVMCLGLMGLLSGLLTVLLMIASGILGYLLPEYLLKWRENSRQLEIRRTLPDALDMIVVCADAGLSLDAGIQRVGRELRLAHPLLASELWLVSRCMELGMSAPEALSQFSARFEIPELRYLATIVREAERFGSSVTKSIRTHAETLRTERMQRAEEAARKASVKMLFPTILFIFPVVFLVVLLPSMLQILRVIGEVLNEG